MYIYIVAFGDSICVYNDNNAPEAWAEILSRLLLSPRWAFRRQKRLWIVFRFLPLPSSASSSAPSIRRKIRCVRFVGQADWTFFGNKYACIIRDNWCLDKIKK